MVSDENDTKDNSNDQEEKKDSEPIPELVLAPAKTLESKTDNKEKVAVPCKKTRSLWIKLELLICVGITLLALSSLLYELDKYYLPGKEVKFAPVKSA